MSEISWSEWVLVYIAIGVVIVLLRSWFNRMLRDAVDVELSVFLWPITLLSWFPYRFNRWRDERKRQRHITEGVRDERYTMSYAMKSFGWNGPLSRWDDFLDRVLRIKRS